jgi:hypothetical protein
MKNSFFSNRVIALVFFASASLTTLAAGTDPGDSAVPVEMKFAGMINEQPLFQLNFSGNANQNDFIILVFDEAGNVLYRESARGEQFTKKFLINTDEIGDQSLRFEIRCTDNKRSVTYEVNKNTRFVQDIAITKTR